MEYLLGTEWRNTARSWTTNVAAKYANRVRDATETELVAAAFVLHGPLVIGGGASLRPAVSRAFGEGATNLLAGVCGIDGYGRGRSRRRREFVDYYDTLLDDDDDDGVDGVNGRRFDDIVRTCSEYMDMNNEMMMAVRRSPWWMKYATAFAVGALSIASVVAWRCLVTKVVGGDIRASSTPLADDVAITRTV